MKMLKTVLPILAAAFAALLWQSCHVLDPDSRDKKIIEESFAAIHAKACIDFRWFGSGQWKLSKDGWSGGGRGPYAVSLRTNEPHCQAVWKLFKSGGPLTRNPHLLNPLFDSNDTEVLLTAMYLFTEVSTNDFTEGQGLWLAREVSPLAAKIRPLLYEHRDVRVRCMAANILKEWSFLALEDIDRMLSDSNLSVQMIGVSSANLVSEQINVGITPLFRQQAYDLELATTREDYYAHNRKLISVLLKHLNDNHFYVRSSCYNLFRSQIGQQAPSSDGGRAINFPDTFPRSPLWWAHESWMTRHEMMKKLQSWWEDNQDKLHI